MEVASPDNSLFIYVDGTDVRMVDADTNVVMYSLVLNSVATDVLFHPFQYWLIFIQDYGEPRVFDLESKQYHDHNDVLEDNWYFEFYYKYYANEPHSKRRCIESDEMLRVNCITNPLQIEMSKQESD